MGWAFRHKLQPQNKRLLFLTWDGIINSLSFCVSIWRINLKKESIGQRNMKAKFLRAT
ncbi:MAG: hypothetical protein Kow0099_28760 [Candidatus Abyssubacteria bacterium]